MSRGLRSSGMPNRIASCCTIARITAARMTRHSSSALSTTRPTPALGPDRSVAEPGASRRKDSAASFRPHTRTDIWAASGTPWGRMEARSMREKPSRRFFTRQCGPTLPPHPVQTGQKCPNRMLSGRTGPIWRTSRCSVETSTIAVNALATISMSRAGEQVSARLIRQVLPVRC